jgi:shikimate dehydrogenase
MDRYVVIGHPIGHSLSPRIHAAFAQQTGRTLQYEAVLAPRDGFSETVRQFQAQGGMGANVTLPFKQEAYALADEVSERARHAQAANTLSFRNGKITADNTDGAGLIRDLTHNNRFTLAGRSALLIGAGGASRGVLLPLLQAGLSELILTNRTIERA